MGFSGDYFRALLLCCLLTLPAWGHERREGTGLKRGGPSALGESPLAAFLKKNQPIITELTIPEKQVDAARNFFDLLAKEPGADFDTLKAADFSVPDAFQVLVTFREAQTADGWKLYREANLGSSNPGMEARIFRAELNTIAESDPVKKLAAATGKSPLALAAFWRNLGWEKDPKFAFKEALNLVYETPKAKRDALAEAVKHILDQPAARRLTFAVGLVKNGEAAGVVEPELTPLLDAWKEKKQDVADYREAAAILADPSKHPGAIERAKKTFARYPGTALARFLATAKQSPDASTQTLARHTVAAISEDDGHGGRKVLGLTLFDRDKMGIPDVAYNPATRLMGFTGQATVSGVSFRAATADDLFQALGDIGDHFSLSTPYSNLDAASRKPAFMLTPKVFSHTASGWVDGVAPVAQRPPPPSRPAPEPVALPAEPTRVNPVRLPSAARRPPPPPAHPGVTAERLAAERKKDADSEIYSQLRLLAALMTDGTGEWSHSDPEKQAKARDELLALLKRAEIDGLPTEAFTLHPGPRTAGGFLLYLKDSAQKPLGSVLIPTPNYSMFSRTKDLSGKPTFAKPFTAEEIENKNRRVRGLALDIRDSHSDRTKDAAEKGLKEALDESHVLLPDYHHVLVEPTTANGETRINLLGEKDEPIGTVVIPAHELAYYAPPKREITAIPPQELANRALQDFQRETASVRSWDTGPPGGVDSIRRLAARELGVRPETLTLGYRKDADGSAYLSVAPSGERRFELARVRVEGGELKVKEARQDVEPDVVRTAAQVVPALAPSDARIFQKPEVRAALETRMAQRTIALKGEGGPKTMNFYAAMAVLLCDPRLGVTRVHSQELFRAKGDSGPSSPPVAITFDGNEVSGGITQLTLANGRTVELFFDMEHISHVTLGQFLYGENGYYKQLKRQGVRLP